MVVMETVLLLSFDISKQPEVFGIKDTKVNLNFVINTRDLSRINRNIYTTVKVYHNGCRSYEK